MVNEFFIILVGSDYCSGEHATTTRDKVGSVQYLAVCVHVFIFRRKCKKDVAVQDFPIVIMMQQLGNILQMHMFHLKHSSWVWLSGV